MFWRKMDFKLCFIERRILHQMVASLYAETEDQNIALEFAKRFLNRGRDHNIARPEKLTENRNGEFQEKFAHIVYLFHQTQGQ